MFNRSLFLLYIFNNIPLIQIKSIDARLLAGVWMYEGDASMEPIDTDVVISKRLMIAMDAQEQESLDVVRLQLTIQQSFILLNLDK